ncbi:MAG: hypothetical protein HFJ04_03815 [Lachnospiraceae bacterium]|nr:hypothetical protein [Lachnospiraceae bacterium]
MYRVFLADDEAWERKAMKKIIQEMELPLLVDGEAEDGIEAWNRLREKIRIFCWQISVCRV